METAKYLKAADAVPPIPNLRSWLESACLLFGTSWHICRFYV